MNDIPLHTRRLVERLLGSYCARICPPTARHAVLLDYRVEADSATLYELRSICGVAEMRRPVPLARFCYRAARNEWRLYAAEEIDDESIVWRRYAARPAGRNFIELLRELDADPRGIFWGRVDGKSLRWCSARGRCADCDEKYCQVLGFIDTVN